MNINLSKLSQIKKVELLEDTVLTGTPEDIVNLSSQLEVTKGHGLSDLEFTSRAVGIACRFKGINWVKSLIQCGASFYLGDPVYSSKYGSGHRGATMTYGEDFSMMLLTNIPKVNETPCSLGEYEWTDDDRLIFGTKGYGVIPESERIEIVRWLIEQNGVEFIGDFLYYAIIGGNTEIADVLMKAGASLLKDNRFSTVISTEKEDNYSIAGRGWQWTEWLEFIRRSSSSEMTAVLSELIRALGNRQLYITQGMLFDDSPLLTAENLELIFDKCNYSKLNMKKLIESVILSDNIPALEELARREYFKQPTKRDAFIDFATKSGKTQSAAWLLEYKNRTADFVGEERAREKKAKAALRIPKATSREVMKKLWDFEKQEDGTLVLTKYKGNETEVDVPEKIGNSKVTALHETFNSMGWAITNDGREVYKKITSVYLPETIRSIGDLTFAGMSLASIQLPGSLETIGRSAFRCCELMQNIEVPEGVKEIKSGAFWGCTALKEILLPAGLTQIGENAFDGTAWIDNCKEGLKYINNYLVAIGDDLENAIISEGTALIADGVIEKIANKCKFLFVPSGISFEKINLHPTERSPLEIIRISESADSISLDFKKFPKLRDIYLPVTVQHLRKVYAVACSDFVVHAPKGSYALNWAIENKLSYEATDDPSIKGERDVSFQFYMMDLTGNYGEWKKNTKNGILIAYYGNDESITIPDSVLEIYDLRGQPGIGASLWSENESVKEIYLNKTRFIYNHAFSGFTKLEKIVFGSDLEELCIDAFEGTNIRELNLPDSLEIIKGTLGSDSKIEKIVLPKKIRRISGTGYPMFYNCPSLEEVTIKAVDAKFEGNPFPRCNKLKYLYCYCPFDTIPQDFKILALRGFLKKYRQGELSEEISWDSYSGYIKRQKKRLMEKYTDEEFLSDIQFFLDSESANK